MATKVVSALKHVSLFMSVCFLIISCEKEIESIGVGLVDNNNFSNSKLISEVVAENIDVTSVISNNIPQYLLGVYSDPEFGKIKASIVSQLSMPLTAGNYDYGTNASIDSVIVHIPYQVTREDNESDGRPKFVIDSVIGNKDIEFQLSVYELKTFLNTLDPEDPSKNVVYYSDKEFQKSETPLYLGNFKINPSDTVSYIKRYLADGSQYSIDTIKQADLNPSIKLPLNEEMIQQIFIDNANGDEFASADAFQHYFRGFYIEANQLVDDKSHLVSLSMGNAKMTIYYSNDDDENENEDLNDNGTNGEQGVRVKHDYAFLFGLLKSNVLVRDKSNSKASGADRLYVQGAAGSDITIELFGEENLEELQSNNWLITNASLTFYVDQDASSNIAPEQLFIYNVDDNVQIKDVITEAAVVGGKLERDEDGNPYKYEFKITDYISELLKLDEPLDLVKLGVKVYNPLNNPYISREGINNKVSNFNWNPKGVVLFGHDANAGDKRIKLEISYSEIE